MRNSLQKRKLNKQREEDEDISRGGKSSRTLQQRSRSAAANRDGTPGRTLRQRVQDVAVKSAAKHRDRQRQLGKAKRLSKSVESMNVRRTSFYGGQLPCTPAGINRRSSTAGGRVRRQLQHAGGVGRCVYVGVSLCSPVVMPYAGSTKAGTP